MAHDVGRRQLISEISAPPQHPNFLSSDDIFQALALGGSAAVVKEMSVTSYKAYQYVASFDIVPTLSRADTGLLDNQSIPNGYIDYGPPTHYRHCWLAYSGMESSQSAPTQGIDPKTTRVAGSGSYFGYLAKYAHLTNTDDSSYADAWLTAVDTSIKTLLRTSTVGEWLILVNYDDNKNIVYVSHLARISRDNWILGTSLFRVNFSLKLIKGGKLTNSDTMDSVYTSMPRSAIEWSVYV
ncbi:hypothetical protein M405DRAFT_933311 [Rhizopogon salebrosus TDB-379]|nr:hypothetical protein M405DRAFT_933311 [Rhizopogon salebrosus TDB-379]